MPVEVRYTSNGHPFPVWKPSRLPRIPDHVLKSCIFLYRSVEDAKAGANTGGSGMLVGVRVDPDQPKPCWAYAVTNKHVAKNASVVRVNTLNGGIDTIDLDPTEWFYPEDGAGDFAVAPISIDKSYDYSMEPIERLLDDAIIAEHALGVGDEVLSMGRFVDLAAGRQNLPLVRFGHVSSMEEIRIKDDSKPPIAQPSYIVEMRSRTGYSGSPVYIYIESRTMEWIERPPVADLRERWKPWVLGVQWGQFPIKDEGGEELSELIGTGMSTVCPAYRIKEFLLKNPKLVAQRRVQRALLDDMPAARNTAASSASGPFVPAVAADEPQHREAFTSLLNAAARTKPQAD